MYGGELIHQISDDFGSIEVIDFQQKIRSLHFGNKTQQSAMLLANPFLLIHKYAQAMMLPLCWKIPARVLILGLGSGSIVKYLYNYFQYIQIDAVELRSQVIDIARDYFLLPDCDNRFQIFNESALDWLDRTQSNLKYDLIVVDMFLTSTKGKDITVDISNYVDKIYRLLSTEGVVAFNQLGDNAFSYSGFDALSEKFTHQLYSIDIDSINTILLATRGSVPKTIKDEMFYHMETSYSLPYSQMFKLMYPVYE